MLQTLPIVSLSFVRSQLFFICVIFYYSCHMFRKWKTQCGTSSSLKSKASVFSMINVNIASPVRKTKASISIFLELESKDTIWLPYSVIT